MLIFMPIFKVDLDYYYGEHVVWSEKEYKYLKILKYKLHLVLLNYFMHYCVVQVCRLWYRYASIQ